MFLAPSRGGYIMDQRTSLFSSRGFLRICLILVTLVMPACYLHAQSAASTGRLEGTVSDQSGAAIVGAEISVRNQNTAITTTVQSSPD